MEKPDSNGVLTNLNFQQTEVEEAFPQPCTFKGVSSAFAAGSLGFLIGFVPSAFRHRGQGWSLSLGDGWRSGQALAIMSGLYTVISCICQRIRLVDDGWNRGVAGCATGLALGWKGGPASALQSCAGLGAVSYIIDFGSPTQVEPAKACCRPWVRTETARCSGYALRQHLLHTFDLPPVMWLAAQCNQKYFSTNLHQSSSVMLD